MAQALTHSARRIVALVVAAAAVVAMLASPGLAEANWHYTKSGAEELARDFVSKRYANTSAGNLSASCRPQGQRHHNPRYKYHRWICVWYDHSDNTYGRVMITGSNAGPGAYYGKVLNGARVYA